MRFSIFPPIAFVAVLITWSPYVSALPQAIEEHLVGGDALAQLPSSPIDQTPSNLTVGRYPPLPYTIVLTKDYFLVINVAESYNRRPLPLVPYIRAFFRGFAADLAAHYPPPDDGPRNAKKVEFDVKDSFTRWTLEVDVLPVLAKPAPTEIVITALLRMSAEVKKFGPPSQLLGYIYTEERLGMKHAVELKIEPLGTAETRETPGTGEGVDTA